MPNDPYAALGVARDATAAEIRRAYRKLALRLHPDRAGVDATAEFQRVAVAYRVLSNASARAAHDAATATRSERGRRGPRPRRHLDHRAPRGAAARARRARRARERPDGVIELRLTLDEVREGGHAAIGLPVRVPCPTCGGCADRNRVWCRRCEFEGAILDDVTVALALPPGIGDGTTFTVPLDAEGEARTLRVCVRHAGAPAKW